MWQAGRVWIYSRALTRFDAVAWDVIAGRFEEYTTGSPKYRFMCEVVDSIRSCAADRLAGFTSMHDLAVTTTPVPVRGPVDVIWVRPQPAATAVTAGSPEVLIEHCAASGLDERIVRPGNDAVRLFWRFAIEKYGVHPNHEG
ncbi:hypothetical protein [Krasilnikovia sp. M28-CT-15]|uniref:hypothetical protein n=1 Tax=Krasilnikovia sp. M28-CT-15 TaxID=3373540 RepID=UPI003877851B